MALPMPSVSQSSLALPEIGVVRTPEDLPIYAHREHILRHIREHRVTHIQGETGCGKSTQVPKYIMEEAAEAKRNGTGDGHTKIVVTQPRRMAAITLARRVASELNEEVGKTVGYKISGDSVNGKLCFATTGFLLQVLVNQPEEFGTYTHVILDEVHERSVDADLLTMLLKLLMQCYRDVKLVVMSATLQAKLFADYFAILESDYGTASSAYSGRLSGHHNRHRYIAPPKLVVEPIFVGVRTFPVEEIFLDEIEQHFNITSGLARIGMDKALHGFHGMGKFGKDKGKGKGKGKAGGGSSSQASGFKRLEPQIAEGFDELCKELVQQMAQEACTLIVFLPGIADITSFYETLSPLDSTRLERRGGVDSDNWRDSRGDASPSSHVSSRRISLRIYPMHSLIPREEQEEVFTAPPPGVCNVVLASNIAESSLTLPSVCGIIDLAMRRSIQYDARRLMSCLVTTWCSQSSCKQRAGRAGRTMPGRAVRLVTRNFFERDMVEFDPPEMLNAPLTKLYLQAKQLCRKLDNLWNEGVIPDDIDMDLSTPTLLLGKVVQPPSVESVEAAITELADVGCIDNPTEDASITPLGYLAMALPCELRLCRLLYVGLMMQRPCDAIAMVAGLTAADPFSTPSLLVLKDEREYCRKLERSFEARRRCDRGRYSEPLMLRDLFAEWIQAGAPRGSKYIGGFAGKLSVIPKKFEAMASEAVDICQRMIKLLKPRSPGYEAVQTLLSTMRFQVDRREELVKSYYPDDHAYRHLFSDDVNLMRAMLCLAFADQMLIQLKPRWAPSGAGGKKRKEELMLETMKKQDLNITGTVVFLNPPQELRQGDAEENYQRLCESMCGERAVRIHWDDKEKLLYCDFKGKPRPMRGSRAAYYDAENSVPEGFDPCPVITDVCPQAHRLHQFGAGRYKFTVETVIDTGWGDGEDGSRPANLELFKPLQPFMINWEVVQHTSGDGGGKKGAKKVSTVKAMPDWRNPLGFACNARSELPAEDLIGVCASVQGLESGGSAFVAGATALGLNHMPLLLCGLDPSKWQLEFGFDNNTGEVSVIKIMHYEIPLPPGTLAQEVLWQVYEVREKLLESLTPWEEEEAQDTYTRGGRGRGPSNYSQYIWVEDISTEIAALLQSIWYPPSPVQKSKKLFFASAVGEPVSDVLMPLQPLAVEPDYNAPTSGPSKQSMSGKKAKAKGGAVENGRSQAYGSRQDATSPKTNGAMKDLIDFLRKQPDHEHKLSSLCGRFPSTNKRTIAKCPELQCYNISQTESMVRLVGYDNGTSSRRQAAQPASRGGGKASRSAVKDRAMAGHNERAHGGAGGLHWSNASRSLYIDKKIDELCSMPRCGCWATDFDNRVKSWFHRFAQHRGHDMLEDAFHMLGEWLTLKEREQVRSWPSYIMTLLRNWEKTTFEGGEMDDDVVD